MAIDMTTPEDRTGAPAAGSRAEVAYQRLKSAIQSRQFEPGQRMREAEIATWLGISRTPVRDALKLLESDGLLVAAPRRGLIIAELDQQQVAEIYALRSALEGLAARMAAQHASSAELSALVDVVERQAQAGPDDDPNALAELNRRFHQLIYGAARNRYLLDVLGSLESSLALLPGTTYSAAGRRDTAHAEHKAIVTAIEAHDPDAAEAAARRHIQEAERVRLLMMLD